MTGAPAQHRQRRYVRLASLTAVAALIALVIAPPGAQGAGAGEHMERYAASYTLSADGSVRVGLDLVYTTGADGAHGPYLTIPVQVATTDQDRDRLYPLSGMEVTSPTGAPAQFTTKLRHGVMYVYIGDPRRTVHGTQEYRVSYTQKGVINHFASHDEFYWNVAQGWDMWIMGATAIVHAPKAAVAATCYAGALGATTPCAKASLTLAADQASGFALPALAGLKAAPGDAAFWESIVPPGQYFTISASYPPGTFGQAAGQVAPSKHAAGEKALPAAAPQYWADPVKRTAYVFEWDKLTRSLAVGAGALGLALLALAGRWVAGRVSGGRAARKRDLVREVPASSQPMAALAAGLPLTGVAGAKTLTAVPRAGPRSAPPGDVKPGEVAMLVTGRPGPNDLAVVLSDLASRGVIGLEPVTPRQGGAGDAIEEQVARAIARATGGGDWLITARMPPAGFAPGRAEQAVLGGLFAGRDAITLKSADGREIRRTVLAMNRAVVRDVAAKKWFRPGLRASQRLWPLWLALLVVWIVAMAGVGTFAAPLGPGAWFGMMGGIFLAVIVLLIALRPPVPRTRKGATTLMQLEQFKAYLAQCCTGERPVTAADAQWAPYAVALGLAVPFARVTGPAAAGSKPADAYPWWLFVSQGVVDVRSVVSPPSSSFDSSPGASGSSGSSGSGSAGGGGGGTGGGSW